MSSQPTDNLTPEQLIQHDQAVDYYLGQLSATERATFEQQLSEDAQLRRIAANAENTLTALHQLSMPATPPASLWPQITRAIQAEKARKTVASSPNQHNAAPKAPGWLAWLAGGSSALALLLLAVVLLPSIFSRSPHHDMPYTAVMQSSNAEPMWLVKANNDMSTLFIDNTKSLNMTAYHGDEACLLWVETPNGSVAITKVPVDGSSMSISIPDDFQQLLHQGGKLFITREHMTSEHDMPHSPSGQMESAGKFISEATI